MSLSLYKNSNEKICKNNKIKTNRQIDLINALKFLIR